jgi:hypothetical protein
MSSKEPVAVTESRPRERRNVTLSVFDPRNSRRSMAATGAGMMRRSSSLK